MHKSLLTVYTLIFFIVTLSFASVRVFVSYFKIRLNQFEVFNGQHINKWCIQFLDIQLYIKYKKYLMNSCLFQASDIFCAAFLSITIPADNIEKKAIPYKSTRKDRQALYIRGFIWGINFLRPFSGPRPFTS